MKIAIYLSMLGFVLILSACSSQESKSSKSDTPEYQPVIINPDIVTDITLNDSMKRVILRRGKKVVHETGLALKKELREAIANEGLEEAISFCSIKAMMITDSISIEKQLIVRRLAKKNRNSANETLDQESDIYKNYVLGWIGGAKLQPLISSDNEGQPVYYHPIKVEKLCLNCHGSLEENIPPGVAEKIAKIYPDDKAVNFEEGQLRGMWAVTFPEYRITNVDLTQRVQ